MGLHRPGWSTSKAPRFTDSALKAVHTRQRNQSSLTMGPGPASDGLWQGPVMTVNLEKGTRLRTCCRHRYADRTASTDGLRRPSRASSTARWDLPQKPQGTGSLVSFVTHDEHYDESRSGQARFIETGRDRLPHSPFPASSRGAARTNRTSRTDCRGRLYADSTVSYQYRK